MAGPRLADRLRDIEPFHVMDILARARALEAAGQSIIHLEIGEPDFPTPGPIVDAGIRSLEAGYTHYTPALGLAELRQAVANSYPGGSNPGAERVVITPGASGALQLLFAALINPGDEVLLADPGYPCNRHFARLFEGRAAPVPVTAETGYQLTSELIREHWTPRTVAVMVASPSNPTGTIVSDAEMARIVDTVAELGGTLIVDEIYQGLTYDADVSSALNHSSDVVVVNSFSKFYGMTGWRVGWIVAPEELVEAIERLAQNIFIAAPTPAQYAALAAFSDDVRAELERRRQIFRERRDYLLPAIQELGFRVPVTPAGAFYLYADCSELTADSFTFAQDLLNEAGVAITPGMDFGSNQPERYVRFSYANEIENLKEAVRRLQQFLSTRR
jgi:aspartate/methionine/tyrosine aminotransferase